MNFYVNPSEQTIRDSVSSFYLLWTRTLPPGVEVVYNGAPATASDDPSDFLVTIIDFLMFGLLASVSLLRSFDADISYVCRNESKVPGG
jgi:hypothetical protein